MKRSLTIAAIAIALLTPSLSHATVKTVSEEWMNILFNGQKIGFSYQKIEELPSEYRITDRAVMRLKVMDMSQDMSFSNVSHLTKDKKLSRFVYLQTIQNQRQKTIGFLKDNVLNLTITGAGGTSTKKIKIDPETRFADGIEFAYADKLKVGVKMSIPIFITALRTTERLTLEVVDKRKEKVGGEMLDVYVIESAIQGVKTTSFVTMEGVKVREVSFMGFTSVRSTEEEALAFGNSYVPITSLITFSLITPDKPINNPQSIRELNLKINGLDDPGFLIKDERQSTGEAERKFDDQRKRSFTIPLKIRKFSPSKKLPLTEVGKASPEDLKPTPEIQSENRMIKNFASEIIGGEKDAWQAARKLNRWVFENVAKKFVDSFTAIDVLMKREGECQSHTNLFAAFARSQGIPTRVASGLVYSPKQKGFLYHAWPEVFVGEWIAMDPTFGQDVADATHIKLIEGGVESQIKLVRYIGRISIDIEKITN